MSINEGQLQQGCTPTQVSSPGVFMMAAHCLPSSKNKGIIRLKNHLGRSYQVKIDTVSLKPIFKKHISKFLSSGKSFHSYLANLAKRNQSEANELVRNDIVFFSLDSSYGDFKKFIQTERTVHSISQLRENPVLASYGTGTDKVAGTSSGEQSTLIFSRYNLEDGFIVRSSGNGSNGKLNHGDSGGPTFQLSPSGRSLNGIVAINTRHSKGKDYFLLVENHKDFVISSTQAHVNRICKQVEVHRETRKLYFPGGPLHNSCTVRTGYDDNGEISQGSA